MTTPLPRLTLCATALAAVISIFAGMASSSEQRDAAQATDSEAWALGRRHAAALVRECADDDQRALRLLDVRARETNIRSRIGDAAADDYIRGFEEGLRENSDSLARVILQ